MIQTSSNGIDYAAEQSVLGAVLLNQDALDEITFLEYRDFAVTSHSEIYKAMRLLEKKGYPVDIITLSEVLMKQELIERIGGVSYLTDLTNSCPTAANVEYYARIIRSKALERRAKSTGNVLSSLSRDDFDTDEEFFSHIEQLVAVLRPEKNEKMRSFTEIKQNYLAHLKKPIQTLKTGFEQFDRWSSGIGRGWLLVLAGRPSVGKTAFLLQLILGVALNNYNQGAIILYSQEMKAEQLIDRWIASSTGINYQKIKHKQLSQNERIQIEEAYARFEAMPIHIQDSAGVTIDEIKSTAKLMKRKFGKIAVIAVDYLQIMSIPQKTGESRATAIGNVTGEAKRIAMDLDCCFILLSQLSRESEKFATKPLLSHLKESSSIEQDADMVQFLWHDPEDKSEKGKVVQQTIAKGRDTGLNEFRLLFKGWLQQFSEL